MASKGKQLSELLDANGDVLQVNLDNIVVNATSVSDTDNTSTGQFTLPSGTTAQRPGSSYSGAQRYNTELGVMEYYNGTLWLKIAAEQVRLDSVTGNIYDGVAGSDLTLTGTGFLTDDITVNFTQSSDSIDEDVVVTATSDTSATVSVPSAVYNNVTAGNVVSITVTNADSTTSDAVNKTAIALPSGGTITTYGNYRVHSFLTSDDLVVPSGFPTTSVDYLLVAGGGTGGERHAGGGGAGGMLTGTSNVTPQTYSIVVGAGGSITYTGGKQGVNGTDSTALGLTAVGGGGGGGASQVGSSGGSGGGSGERQNSTSRGSGTSGQGNDGGYVNTGNYAGGAGGGGKGAAGANGPTSSGQIPGNGGDGIQNSIRTGSNVYYAGGGGGGGYNLQTSGTSSGGQGGGANGGLWISGNYTTINTAPSGQANTGGGGGGGMTDGNVNLSNGAAGNGGSGICVIRYDITAI